jgi:hypothetical protein
VDILRQRWHDASVINDTESQFSLTGAASIPGGRAKNKFLPVSAGTGTSLTRRRFLGGAVAAAASASALASWPALAAEEAAPAAQPAQPTRKLKLGVVGNGRRDCWIAQLVSHVSAP